MLGAGSHLPIHVGKLATILVARELEQFGKVLAHLVFPEGPIVATERTPIVYGMANAFAREDFG